MFKAVIAVDMDNTLEDLVTPWLNILNKKYGLHYTLNDIKYFDMERSIPELTHEQLYSALYDTKLFDQVKPLPGAVSWLERLNNDPRFDIYIVTNSHYKTISVKMEKILMKYFPFLNWRQIVCLSKKQLFMADILIDDYENNLIGGNYDKILYNMPYNINVNTIDISNENFDKNQIKRAYSWAEIYNYLDKKYK